MGDWRLGVAVVVGFALGSIPFGVILARARGIDLRKIGSGNIGATNTARALGKRSGGIVLALDAAKAYLPTATALWLGLGPKVAAAAGGAAFLGHVFSPFLRFRGGKGVACGLGTFLALAPLATVLAALVFAGTFALTRIGALGSLLGGLALLPALYLLRAPLVYRELAALMFIVILWRHRGNIARMARGREHRL